MALYQAGAGLSALVGIGTTNPSYQFHVSNVSTTSSTSAAFLTPSLGTSGAGNFIQVGTAISTYQSAALGFLNYGTNTSNVCQISINGIGGSAINIISSGVGIGTTSLGGGQGKLFVANDVTLTSGNYAGDVAAQIMAVGSANPLKRLALMYDTNNNIGLVQAMIAGTGTSPLILNGAGGNVGIGITNPAYALHTYGGSIGVSGTNNYLYYAVTNSTASGAYMMFDAATAGGSGRKYQIGSSGTGNNPGTGCFELYDATGGATRLVCTGSGNIGLNVTAPIRQFHMYGEASFTSPYSSMFFNLSDSAGNNGSNYTAVFRGLGSAGTAQVNMGGFSVLANTTYLSGSVGIGTTSPSDLLHVYGTSNPSIRIDAGAGGTTDPRVQFYSGSSFRGRVAYSYGGNYMYYQNDTQDVLRFYPGSGGAVSLQPSSGNVGIGITNPSAKLQVSNGDTSMTLYGPNSTWSAYLVTGAGPSQVASGKAQMITTNGNLHIDCGTGQALYLNYYTGGAGVGGTIVSWGPWTHTGNFTATGNIASSSDRRIKTDLEIIPDALDKIKKINGYTFTRTDNGSIGRQAGVIAQEVKDVLPEVIHENQDGMYSVSYGNLIALLIEGLKEETRKREELEKLLLNRM